MTSPTSAFMATMATIACLLLAGLAGCQQDTQEQVEVPVNLNQVRADLETLSTARVYFAHQSVGRNLLKGIEMLLEETNVALKIEEVKPGLPISEGPGLFHANVGENGVADSKISAFVADVSEPGLASYDVALLKFCYTDLSTESEDRSAPDLFERYKRTMAEVEAQQPDLTVLHVTMPLLAEPPGRKAKLKRLLGMATITDQGNIMRSEYNEILRAEASSTEIFDVARLEATHSDGSPSTFSAGGREVEMLAREHTHDGGHLDDPAKRYFAAAFLHSLAEAVRHRETSVTANATESS